jgi:hypothetical protein
MLRWMMAFALAGALVATDLRAERPPQSREMAEAVVVGTIEKITPVKKPFAGDGEMTTYRAMIRIARVERGDRLQAGKTVTVTWFHVTKLPSEPMPGAYGHAYKVQPKDRVRVWLMTADKGTYAVIYNPDGFEKLKK